MHLQQTTFENIAAKGDIADNEQFFQLHPAIIFSYISFFSPDIMFATADVLYVRKGLIIV